VSFDPEEFDAFEAEGWAAKEAAAYDAALGSRVTARLAEHLLDAVEASEGVSLLDVATGPGYVADRAVARGAQVVGLDLSEAMLEFARAHVPGAEFVHGDATSLPFQDSSFDAVTAAFVLLHLGRPELAVAEAVRVLSPGGRVAFTVWDEPTRGRWLGVLLDAVADVGAAPPADIPPGPPIFRFADDVEFERLLSNSGLEHAVVQTIDFSLRVQSAAELWDGLVEGTVRVRPLVVAQSEETQQAIRARFDELLEEYRDGDGFEVPVAVKLGSGRKP
jgi:SAM-dependent methyltransferase